MSNILRGKKKERSKIIISWLERIEKSNLSITDYFKEFNVPFSRSQYYIYNKSYKEYGALGLQDKRCEGGNKKVTPEIEAFITGTQQS